VCTLLELRFARLSCPKGAASQCDAKTCHLVGPESVQDRLWSVCCAAAAASIQIQRPGRDSSADSGAFKDNFTIVIVAAYL